MPYVIEESSIKTKLFGVSIKSENIGRQQLLIMLRQNPNVFTKVWIEDCCICVEYDNQNFVLGRMREEYSSLLKSHDCEIIELSVTGGYSIQNAGIANLGCNVVIKLSKKELVEKGKSLPLRPHEKARIELLESNGNSKV